jgi:hypothetical protein
MDILVKPDRENAKAVHATPAKFGALIEGLTPADLGERGPFFRMSRDPVAVDIPGEIPGVEFDAAWEHRVHHTIEAAAGLKETSCPLPTS